MQKGYLTVQTAAANGAVPVAAHIVILRGGEVWLETVTDASGRTASVELDAPDRAESLRPDADVLPYSTVDVQVTAPPFRSVEIRGVPVFAGETTVLPVGLEPARRTANGGESVLFDIPPYRLDGADQTEQMPTAGIAAQRLDAVAVPQTITVHLGHPDAPAHNRTVDFANYIKNVCSSELYPTWPEAALRAMIHCRVSLALNRVYTGWYRGKGYGFDITNAPGCDPRFVPGRNLYGNISRLVDETLNIYIRQPNLAEPLFPRCSGSDGGCGQWKAVALAQEGLSPLNILRRLYGAGCSLAQTEQVQCAAQRYPGITLTVGSDGEAVRTLQRQLQQIRQTYPAIPALPSDGVYGAETKLAVQAFQQLFNLPADGVVGRAEWYKTGRVAAAVRQYVEAERGAAQFQINPRPPQVLCPGSSGEAVALAQFLLGVAASFYSGVPPVAVDGVFGRGTQDAVTDFQRMMGIEPDGLIGEAAWDGLYEIYFNCRNAVERIF